MNLADCPQMLPYADIEATVSRMAYRPGWSLSTFIDPHEGPKLRILASVPDGYHPGRSIDLGITARIPTLVRSRADLAEWVLWRLLEVEAHECREYFRIGGVLYRDPHDPIEP